MKHSLLTGRPAHDGGCYHCKHGAEPCFCPGKSEDVMRYEEDATTHSYPTYSDVRDRCEEMLHALLSQYATIDEFNVNFIQGVRDLMRDGVPFEDAVGSFAPEIVDEEEAEGAAALAAFEADCASIAQVLAEPSFANFLPKQFRQPESPPPTQVNYVPSRNYPF